MPWFGANWKEGQIGELFCPQAQHRALLSGDTDGVPVTSCTLENGIQRWSVLPGMPLGWGLNRASSLGKWKISNFQETEMIHQPPGMDHPNWSSISKETRNCCESKPHWIHDDRVVISIPTHRSHIHPRPKQISGAGVLWLRGPWWPWSSELLPLEEPQCGCWNTSKTTLHQLKWLFHNGANPTLSCWSTDQEYIHKTGIARWDL